MIVKITMKASTPRTIERHTILNYSSLTGPWLIILGPSMTNDVARVMRTSMSRTPRNRVEKTKGGELRAYLREESDLLTA